MSCTTTETSGPVARYDGFVIPIDTHWTVTMTHMESDGTTPISLVGYTARAVLACVGQTSIELTTENGRIALGGALGTIALTLTEAVTETMAAGVYTYGLDLINGSSQKTRLIEGNITVTADTTPDV